MKKGFKLCMLLMFMTIVTMLFTTNVYAAQINDMSDLQGVFSGATINENKITLDSNYDLEDNALIIESGTYEIDLKGFDITSNEISTIEILNGNLTISNSSSSLGIIRTTSKNIFASPVYIEDGNLIINDGKLGDPTDASDVGLYIGDGTVTINDGEIAGLIHGIYMESGALTINDGIFKSTTLMRANNAIGIYGGTVIVNNGIFESSNLDGAGWGLYAENTYIPLSITINDGLFTGSIIGAEFYKETNSEFSILIKNGTFIGNNSGLALNKEIISNIQIEAGKFKAVSSTIGERYGAIAIEYEVTPPSINDILKEGSSISSDSTSTSSYIYGNVETLILRTVDEVVIGIPKTIRIPESAHGIITANKLAAIPGEKITLTITPEDGYILKQVQVLDRFGENPVTVTNQKFIMPNYNVLVSSEFEKDIDYIFISGANQKFDKYSKNNLNFTINADYGLLDKVYVDNKLLTTDDFSATSGSTIITLKNSFLNTLKVKKHSLKVTFTNGKEAATQFEILAEQNPETGDGILLYIYIGSISLIGLLVLSIYSKKKKIQL